MQGTPDVLQVGGERDLVLREWEVWHTYTMYFEGGLSDLEVAARNLVATGIAGSAILDGGRSIWGADADCAGNVEIAFDANRQHASVKIPAGPSGYALQGLFETSWMRYGERMLFGDDSRLPSPYFRTLLGQCTLFHERGASLVYPLITLYADGIATVSLRMISPARPVHLQEFIHHYVNAPLIGYTRVLSPAAVARLAPLALISTAVGSKRPRLSSLFGQRLHEQAIRERTVVDTQGDFAFEQAPLPVEHDDRDYTLLSDVALTVLRTCWFGAHVPAGGLLSTVLPRPKVPPVGSYWTGRPHVHLLRFADQAETAKGNEARHGGALGAILARSATKDLSETRRFLPQNARTLGDMGVYVSEAGTLWVHSRRTWRAASQMPWADVNHAHVVYEHHAKVEMLEYGYATHRRMAERVRSRESTVSEALGAQRNLIDLELQMAEAGRYGEIRDLLVAGWKAWGVDRLRDATARLLAVRQAEADHHTSARSGRASTYLAIVAVLLAAPPLATVFVKPAWSLFGWWPVGKTFEESFYALIAMLATGILILVGHSLVGMIRGSRAP